VVDDEELARDRLKSLLSREPRIEVIGEAGDGKTAVAAIEKMKPDLVFLDVQMPELNGFEVLEALDPEMRPNVVFCTAHDKFALKAFDVHAVDYLLKPFDKERFQTAIQRAIAKVEAEGGQKDAAVNAVLKEVRPAGPVERLLVKAGGRVLLIKVEDIDYVEAADNYVNLHVGKDSHMMRETMGSLENKLPADRFMRISRSAIVNVERIQELQPMFHGEYVVVLKNGNKLTLSRSYRDQLDRLLGSSG
jgi:two-component system LytT family response regulator